MIKYDKYKSSGIDWLGDIPEHWEVKREVEKAIEKLQEYCTAIITLAVTGKINVMEDSI